MGLTAFLGREGGSVLLEAEAEFWLPSGSSIKRGWGGWNSSQVSWKCRGSLRECGVEGEALGDLVESVLLIDKGLPSMEKGKEIQFSYVTPIYWRNTRPSSLAGSREGWDCEVAPGQGILTREWDNPGASDEVHLQNPKSGFAGKILEEAGCKGLKAGAGSISPHANFIVNNGSANSKI